MRIRWLFEGGALNTDWVNLALRILTPDSIANTKVNQIVYMVESHGFTMEFLGISHLFSE